MAIHWIHNSEEMFEKLVFVLNFEQSNRHFDRFEHIILSTYLEWGDYNLMVNILSYIQYNKPSLAQTNHKS